MSRNPLAFAQGFTKFVDASPTAFHAVREVANILSSKGYVQLKEKDSWELKAGGKYFFTRNQSVIIAFAVGGKYQSGSPFKIVGAHTDSPHLKIKPKSNIKDKSGYLMLGVECYGGAIWHTWFDRDLTVAGRVFVSSSLSSSSSPTINSHLVSISRPILRIPSLAIHLDRSANESFVANKEDNVRPLLATQVKLQLNLETDGVATQGEGEKGGVAQELHHKSLIALLAKEIGCDARQIQDVELSVVDTQPAAIGGMFDEFIFAPRIDNLLSCYVATHAIVDSDESLAQEDGIRVLALFDHEEVGSGSAVGASSALVPLTLQRISHSLGGGKDDYERTISASFLVSLDMAHAIHPNYAGKHEESHQPAIHKGLVVKTNQNQRYCTNVHSALLFRTIAQRVGVSIQDFVVRNDAMCGSTIGPLMSISTGIRGVDVGIPQLSMHSVREMCGVDDVTHATTMLTGFFTHYQDVAGSINMD